MQEFVYKWRLVASAGLDRLIRGPTKNEKLYRVLNRDGIGFGVSAAGTSKCLLQIDAKESQQRNFLPHT